MKNLDGKKIAIVCDWIKDMGGAEVVLKQLLEIFPNALIFSSVFFAKGNEIFKNRIINTSFIQKIPFFNKYHKLALFLRPQAFESFDLSEYDIVISLTSAESKGVITKPNTIHICYCHTPTRYFWSHYHEYLNMMEFGIFNLFGKWLMPKVVHKLRIWDFCAAQRPDYFITNSENTKKRIKKYYNRESDVIRPCIDISEFRFNDDKKDFYLYIGRCIPYKKFDLIVDSFNKNGKEIILVTNTQNKLYRELKLKSKKNIKWRFNITNIERKELYSEAKAFIFPPDEDFGIVPIEAMVSGTPVIAYSKGGALETVIDGKTGIFFDEQNVESLNEAITKFEKMNFDYKEIRKHAENFDSKIFKNRILKFIEDRS